MDRRFGLARVTAREQLQRLPEVSRKPHALPLGAPAVVSAASVGVTDSETLSLLVIGDHGGVKDPAPQLAVAKALERAPGAAGAAVAAVVSVGDVVYFHGDPSEYAAQFYEPYAHVSAPILAIPGNHDGDVEEDDASAPTGRQPLDTFMENFCTSSPTAPLSDQELEFGRHTQTLPWCDWAVEFQALTLIGVYSNVPSGGHLEDSQIAWLGETLAAARAGVPVIVMVHHPPYSVDAHHGGSKIIGDALDQAFAAGKRYPDLVLSGHVHDYQRFSRLIDGWAIPYVVIGNSGYHNLHALARDAQPGMDLGGGVTFAHGDASAYGFLYLTVSGSTITATYVQIKPGRMPDGSDAGATVAETWSVANGVITHTNGG